MKKLLFLLFISPMAHADMVQAISSATVVNQLAGKGQAISISSSNTNQVTNNSDNPIDVEACYNIDVENCGQSINCWKVKVAPHGTWRDTFSPFKNCVFQATGNYHIKAVSKVDNYAINLHSEYSAFANVAVS